MSKRNYLLAVLMICAAGYMLTSQLRLTTQTASELISMEVEKKIRSHISKAYQQLKRFPNSDNELQRQVLSPLKTGKFNRYVSVINVSPGSQITPARFQIKISPNATTKTTIHSFEYYGNDYKGDLSRKGMLISIY